MIDKRGEVALVSIMHVNNEIGVQQDVKDIGALCKKYGTFFHTDAAQSVGTLFLLFSSLSSFYSLVHFFFFSLVSKSLYALFAHHHFR